METPAEWSRIFFTPSGENLLIRGFSRMLRGSSQLTNP